MQIGQDIRHVHKRLDQIAFKLGVPDDGGD